jgi:hypothetical protein
MLKGVLVGRPTEIRSQDLSTGSGQKASTEHHELCRATGDKNFARFTISGNASQLPLEAADALPTRKCRKTLAVGGGPGREAVLEKLLEVQAGGLFGRKSDEFEMCLLGLR